MDLDLPGAALAWGLGVGFLVALAGAVMVALGDPGGWWVLLQAPVAGFFAAALVMFAHGVWRLW